jgi:hypothetical protein
VGTIANRVVTFAFLDVAIANGIANLAFPDVTIANRVANFAFPAAAFGGKNRFAAKTASKDTPTGQKCLKSGQTGSQWPN